MPIKILMPALSPTMEHGNLAKWLKKEGEQIKAGEVIAEIETDKATMEVEAVEEGVLAKIIVPEGSEDVAVNALIAVLLEDGENKNDLEDFITKSTSPSPNLSKENNIPEENTSALNIKSSEFSSLSDIRPATGASRPDSNRIFVSPLAKRIAADRGINLSDLTGSGPRGRIIKADILAADIPIKNKIARDPEEFKLILNNNMRKVIAKRLVDSKQNIPHFYLTIECIMDPVLEARAELNTNFGDNKNNKLSVNDFVIMASAKGLKEVPQANASWRDDAIIMYNNIDISIAVAIEGGLITPIIRNADQKTITNISTQMKDLAKRARENSLKPEEFQGGGFSISNLGMYGVLNFNAIINPPQGCILAVGMSRKKAVVIDDNIAIKTVMEVTLSCDHRVVDGATGALFLASFKKYIESPILMFV